MAEPDAYDEQVSETQEAWQDIARRLRIQLERSLSCIEKVVAKAEDDDAATSEILERLSSSAIAIFALERQAANLDTHIRRDAGY